MRKIDELYTKTIYFIELLEELPLEISEEESFLILQEFDKLKDCYFGIIIDKKNNHNLLENLTWSFTSKLLLSNRDNPFFEQMISDFKELSCLYLHLSINNLMKKNVLSN